MKKNKKSKGSSTILVILIVITVVLFGVMNMMTVYTSYKISKKNLDWTKNYYELDSKANIFANKLKNQIDKTSKGQEINILSLLNELESIIDNNTKVIINEQPIHLPIDKNTIKLQGEHLNVETYFIDDEGIKRFYTNIKIPKIKTESGFEILSWKRINQEFEYTDLVFSENEEVVIP